MNKPARNEPQPGLIELNQFSSRSRVACLYDTEAVDLETATLDLSDLERQHTLELDDPMEKRHFVLRRSFQRNYVKLVTASASPLPALELQHRQDTPTSYAPDPQLNLTFSSSDKLFVAASQRSGKIGIDVEKHRVIENPVELAVRFFHPGEEQYFRSLNAQNQQSEFLKFWTIKEACLKAIGKGVVYGLAAFIIRPAGNSYHVEPPSEYGKCDDWKIDVKSLEGGYWVTVAQFN
jgi:4'-phosphopantetheinyl transferase